jgi:hypothetical protein
VIVTGGVVSAMSSNASAASGAAPPIASLASGRPAHRGTGIQWRFACRKRRRKRRVLCGRGRDRQRQAIAFLSGALCRSLTAAQDLQNIIERLAVEHWTRPETEAPQGRRGRRHLLPCWRPNSSRQRRRASSKSIICASTTPGRRCGDAACGARGRRFAHRLRRGFRSRGHRHACRTHPG